MNAYKAHYTGPQLTSDWRLFAIAAFVLAVMLFYIYAAAYLAPYPGFSINAAHKVTEINTCEAGWLLQQGETLQTGDQLLVVGNLDLEKPGYRTRVVFGGYRPGDIVTITFRRDGREQSVDWQMPQVVFGNRVCRVLTLIPLPTPFWLVGTVIILFLQPHDMRWRLLVAFTYLYAIWMASGSGLLGYIAYSNLLAHACTWLLVPTYLHFHLIVPSPLAQRRLHYVIPVFWTVGVLFLCLDVLQIIPQSLFTLGLLAVFLVCIGLMIVRLVCKPSDSDRLTIYLMLIGICMALGPGIVLHILPLWVPESLAGAYGLPGFVSLIAISLQALFYAYAVYKRRLGRWESWGKRLLVWCCFLLLYAVTAILILQIVGRLANSLEALVAFSLMILVILAASSLPIYSRFKRLADQLLYGTKYDSEEITRAFAREISQISDYRLMLRSLASEVTQSLRIHQSALALLADGNVNLIYWLGVEQDKTPQTHDDVYSLLDTASLYQPPRPGNEEPDRFDWVRLAIPLRCAGDVGIWLFGQRYPDDYYSAEDIKLLLILAGQLAMKNTTEGYFSKKEN
jgi:hypothetical protein